MNQLPNCLFLAALISAVSASSTRAQQSPPSPQVVDLKSADGTLLKATYFSAGKPGPGVLLFHQSNRTRESWEQVEQQLTEARRKDPKTQLWPEVNVDIIGSDYLYEAEDEKKAGHLQAAERWRADARYNLADASPRVGEKALARQLAQEALALLDAHKVPLSSWSDTDERRSEIRSAVQQTLKTLGAAH